MALISKKDGMTRLLPYTGKLRAAVREAWRRWLHDFKPKYLSAGPRSERNLVHDLIVEELGKAFAAVPRCGLTKRENRNLLILDDDLILAVKHLNTRRRPANYPTETALAFNDQQTLPGFLEGVHLILGYVLDELEMEIEDVCVILPNGSTNAWCHSLDSDRSSEIRELLPRPESATRQPRARVKDGAREKRNRNGTRE
jgi:hypothetical protein